MLISVIELLKHHFKGEIVGEPKTGRSGEVYIVDNGAHTIPRYIAYKTIKTKFRLDEIKQREFLEECKTWFRITNRFIITPFYAKVIDGQPFICMPYCEMNLADLMLANDFSYEQTLVLSCQLIKGLISLRKKGIAQHQDFNPPNILIQDLSKKMSGYPIYNLVNLDLKISDFGIANLREKIGPTLGGEGGKFPFKAPEQYFPKRYSSYNPDIFALGVVIFMLFKGEHPNGFHKKKALNRNTSGSYFEKWAFSNPTITVANSRISNLINGTIKEIPNERPSLEELFSAFMEELHMADENAYSNLELRFRFYDGLDEHQYRINELFTLSKIAELPEARSDVIDNLVALSVDQRNRITNSSDAVYYFEIVKHILQLSRRNKQPKSFVAEQMRFVIDQIIKWRKDFKITDKYAEFDIDGLKYFTPPDVSDYDFVSDYATMAFKSLELISSRTETERYIHSLNNEFVLSMFYYYLAHEQGWENLSNAFENLEKAKKLVPNESVFDYRKFHFISQYLKRSENTKERNVLISIANKALVQAKILAPHWKFLQEESPIGM